MTIFGLWPLRHIRIVIPTQGASFVARQGPLETEKGLWISGDRLGQKRPMKIKKIPELLFQNCHSDSDKGPWRQRKVPKYTNGKNHQWKSKLSRSIIPELWFRFRNGPGKNDQWKSKPSTQVDPSSVIINLVVRLFHDQQQPKFYNLSRYLQYVYMHYIAWCWADGRSSHISKSKV